MLAFSEINDFVQKRVFLDEPGRRQQVLKWLRHYEGKQKGYIPKNRNESDDHFAGRPKIWFNLTRKILDRKTKLYSRAAERSTPDDVVRQFWNDVKIDRRMREISPIVRLCGTVIVMPEFVVRAKEPLFDKLRRWFFRANRDGYFEFRAYTPNQVEVLTYPGRPEVPQLLVFPHGEPAGRNCDVWSDERTWKFRDGKCADQVGEAHRFGRIPFGVLRHDPDWTEDFWGRAEAHNLVDQNMEINRLCSSLQWLVICQSHGQMVAKGAPENWKPKMGPDTIIMLPPDTDEETVDFDIKAPVADPEGLQKTIDWNVDMVCMANDVAAGTYRLDVNRQSGLSLIEKRAATREDNAQSRPVALEWEEELAALARLIYEVRQGRKVTHERPEIRVNFREPELPQTTGDRVQREQHELGTGQTTGPKLLQRHDPDLTVEEATKLYEENVAYNQTHAAAAVEAGIEDLPVTLEARKTAAAAAAAAAGGSAPPPVEPEAGRAPGSEPPAPTAGMGRPKARNPLRSST